MCSDAVQQLTRGFAGYMQYLPMFLYQIGLVNIKL